MSHRKVRDNMWIAIEIPDKDIPQRQDTIDVYLSFIDGQVCECNYPFSQLKTGNWLEGYCSECGCDIPAYIIDWKYQKDMDAKSYPNCGAKMESEG